MAVTAKQRRRAEKKERTALAREVRVELHVRPDWEYTSLILVRCDECGLEQSNKLFPRVGCVVCGCRYGMFASFLEPNPRDVPRIESARGPAIVGRWW